MDVRLLDLESATSSVTLADVSRYYAVRLLGSYFCMFTYLVVFSLATATLVLDLCGFSMFIYFEAAVVSFLTIELLLSILAWQRRFFLFCSHVADLFIWFSSITLFVLTLAVIPKDHLVRDWSRRDGFLIGSIDDMLFLFRYLVQLIRLFLFLKRAYRSHQIRSASPISFNEPNILDGFNSPGNEQYVSLAGNEEAKPL